MTTMAPRQNHHRASRSLQCLLVLIVIFSGNVVKTHAKRLVLFAGPRRSAATSVEEFFHKYAHGWVSCNAQKNEVRH